MKCIQIWSGYQTGGGGVGIHSLYLELWTKVQRIKLSGCVSICGPSHMCLS